MSTELSTIETLQRLEQKIDGLEASILNQKAVLTFEQAAKYAGMSRSYLYKLTSTGRIPHYKPNGKLIYINREELDAWLQRSQTYREQTEIQAATYVTLNRKGGRP